MATTHHLRARDGRLLSVWEGGAPDGVPLLLHHGTPGGRLTFAHLDDLYAQLGYRALCADRPGYGDSDDLPGRTVLDVAQDSVDVLDALDVDRAVVVGGSGGGPHALALGAAAPARVRALGVLVGAVPLTPAEVAPQVSLNREAFARLDDEDSLRSYVEQARKVLLVDGIAALLHDSAPADLAVLEARSDAFTAVMEPALAAGTDGWVADYLALWKRPWGFVPADVAVHVLWAHGTADLNVPLEAARRVIDALPDCDLRVWHSGHLVGPELVIAFYQDLLASQGSRP